jgi:hypothetical protein
VFADVESLQRGNCRCGVEGFNLFNHGNLLGRADDLRGCGTANPTFGQLVSVGTTSNALPNLANIDPPRMAQFQIWHSSR